MKKTIYLIMMIGAIAAIACGGVDPDLLASGKAHACAIQEVEQKLTGDPENAELLAELEDRRGLLDAVIGSAPEGSQAALEKAIEEAAASCP